jgi:hypothetical protein
VDHGELPRKPDNGVILASYVGQLLMAGGYLAIGACVSAITKNQVIAFVLSLMLCLVFILSGFPMVLDFVSGWTPPAGRRRRALVQLPDPLQLDHERRDRRP